MTHQEASKSNAASALKHLEAMAGVLSAKITKDECGHAAILGKSISSIHAGPTGQYYILVSLDTPGQYNAATRKLDKFATCEQQAETEGCWLMTTLPTKAQAAILRKILGIRKTRQLDRQSKAQMAANLKKTA